MILNSIFRKNAVSGVFNSWLDLIFPPLCANCREFCRTSFFCFPCWELCTPVSVLYRCRHCFTEIEEASETYNLCFTCQKEPLLSVPYASVFEPTELAYRLCQEKEEIPEALAAFALYQWAHLSWSSPQVVVPMPEAKELAKPFASWLQIPHIDLLSTYNQIWECAHEKIEEDQIVLLLDVNSDLVCLQKAVAALSEAFPKRIYVLSLIHHDFSDHS